MMQSAVERLDLPHWDYSDAHSTVHKPAQQPETKAQTQTPTPNSWQIKVGPLNLIKATQSPLNTQASPSPRQVTLEKEELEDRTALQQVRYTVNDFRDSNWEGIIQARNYRVEATTFTGLAAYLLLIVALLPAILTKPLQAATIFFLVGATVGLFNQLRAGVESNTRVDDYGLWHSRLVSTPVFSGLAALGGVVLFAMVPALLNGEAIAPQTATPTPTVSATTVPASTAIATSAGRATETTPTVSTTVSASATTTTTTSPTANQTPSPTHSVTPIPPTASPTPVPGAAAPPKHIPPIDDIFSLERNLFGLLVAATFGLVPALLFGALQKQVNNYNLNIQSTEPQEKSRSSNS